MKKLAFYKAEDWNGYMQQYLENQKAFAGCMTDMAQKGCEWIEITDENYKKSLAHYY